ncbi:MAG TPA: hypothetical protein VKI17_04890, partial [Gemmataceae bacterium]|nr:hypothetical protein [Gemmataceae bacterium]
MKRWLLAIAALLGAHTALVHADYVIIKINLAVARDKDEPGGQQNAAGPEGGMMGMMQQGMMGRMQGQGRGMQGQMGRMGGMMPGARGQGGRNPEGGD